MKFRHCKRLGFLLGLVLTLAPRPGHAASYAPLDCAKASTAAETTVCKAYALGQDEARLATLFGVLTSLVAMGQRADLVDTQRRWISVREACGSNAVPFRSLSDADQRALAGARCIGEARTILDWSLSAFFGPRRLDVCPLRAKTAHSLKDAFGPIVELAVEPAVLLDGLRAQPHDAYLRSPAG
jgi:uncharacterized protein YecT (DUF1311 family)